ncbi:hypothetical protein LPJ75_004360, partial [Coemansia sp. RSA 2598]
MAPSKLSNDARKKLAANLQVLRRYDEQIEAIVDTTSHAVLYRFQEDTQSWATMSVEGALFIYKRATAPYYGFTVLNRVGIDNYTELLSADMSFQTSDQIAIYTSKSGSGIVGIWMYEEADRVRVPEQLSMCCKSSASAFAGQGPQCLYPKNDEEKKEFMRMYPRSRSNSKRDAGPDGSGSNALSTIINRTRQQQRKSSQSAMKNDSATANDLVSKLQAIGLDPSGVAGAQPQQAKESANTLQLDPAIIMARKSVKPHEMQQLAATSGAGNGSYSQAQSQAQVHVGGSVESSSAFKSPISVPAAHTYGQNGNSATAATPASPVLHPVASPFPPSTIATPLPGQCPPRADPGLAYMAHPQQFWHPQMGTTPVPRSAHASPAPMGFGMVPGMHSFPQLPMGHPGAAHTPQPGMSMTPVQFVPGMPMQHLPPLGPSSQPGNAAETLSAQAVSSPQQQQQQPLAQGAGPSAGPTPMTSSSGNTSMAQSLAEQLVSLVRQRMSAVQQNGGGSQQPVSTAAPAPGNGSVGGAASQQPASAPALPPNAVKMQRDYCREWLIRVIQADDELVDAFAQR